MNSTLSIDIQKDIENILNINAVPSILNVICKSTGMRFAGIARVTDKIWITCAAKDDVNFGLVPGSELDIETTFCNQIRKTNTPVIIEDTPNCSIYKDHPIPKMYGIISYISFPLYRRNGDFFGTLCAIDTKPAKINNEETKELFKLSTELISFHLDAIEEVNKMKINLREEKRISELRETFIAILAHDLRNPLSSIRLCTEFLQQLGLPEETVQPLNMIYSTSYRMQDLVDNLLDFAKGHLGDGIKLKKENNKEKLEQKLINVLEELKIINENVLIQQSISITQDVNCDIFRICQVYSNLVQNAIVHGASGSPIQTEIKTENNTFVISVSNSGEKISKEKIKNIFTPFFTTNTENKKSGLGLGLYIASQIAKAHEGELNVDSNDRKTTFTLLIPLHR